MLRSLFVVIGFGLLVLFPAWEAVTRWLPDFPLDEKRLSVPPPQWHSSPALKNYLMGWQKWFNDRYAGRNLLIRLKTQLDYSLFSYSDRVYIGRDGWLFYRSVLDEERPALESWRPSDIDGLILQFRNLRIWLAARNINLVIIDNPLKDTFYPEMLPLSAPKFPSPSRGEEIRNRLRAETGALVIDTTGILSEVKRERPIFHRTDFHWNDPAAFAVAKDTVNRMAGLARMPSRGWRIKLEIEKRPLSGGEASFMPLLRPVTETALFVRPSWNNADSAYAFNQGIFEYVQRLRSPPVPLLPTVVVFGDSFFDGMARSGFGEHFTSVYRVRTFSASLQATLEHLPPDARFVVIESIETGLGLFTIPLDFAALDRAFPKPKGAPIR